MTRIELKNNGFTIKIILVLKNETEFLKFTQMRSADICNFSVNCIPENPPMKEHIKIILISNF